MDRRTVVLILGALASSTAMAEACKVSQNANSAQVPAVVLESCYEFTGVPAGTIDWSCSNESNQPQGSDKQKVATCSRDYKARCSATLTQESLANHRSTGEGQAGNLDNLPDDAKVITYYYSLENRQQARIDCENSRGTWTAQ